VTDEGARNPSSRGFGGEDPFTRRSSSPRVVVVGMGSEWRRDDGVGPAVVRRVEEHAADGGFARCRIVVPLADPLDLLGLWDGADLAVVVDATRSGLSPGTISRIELGDERKETTGDASGCPLHSHGTADESVADASSSTHGIGLTGVVRLSRIIERAPRRIVVVAVEGEDFGQGTELSPAVASSVDEAANCVIELIWESLACA